MTASFTPGPWRIDTSLSAFSTYIMSGDRVLVETDNVGEEADANTSLIATAPSLYSDAEFLCARIRELESSLTDDGEASQQYFGHILPAVARMESCLAEARGGEAA